MNALDTNVLLRVFVNDDEAQHAAVLELVGNKAVTPLLVSGLVLAEFVRILRRRLGQTRQRVVEMVERILEAPEFVVADAAEVTEALAVYRGGGVDFSDCLIVAAARAAGADAVFTFDRDAARRIPGARLIEI
jgi:predicted nucleic-acid-binding protein